MKTEDIVPDSADWSFVDNRVDHPITMRAPSVMLHSLEAEETHACMHAL